MKLNIATLTAFVVSAGSVDAQRPKPVCEVKSVRYNAEVPRILSTAGPDVQYGLMEYQMEGWEIGSIQESLAESSDAATTGILIEDGKSGNLNFPHGNMKPIVTMGERSVCEGSSGKKVVGVPDGIGAYLPDDSTVRVVFQSESYGPLIGPTFQSWPFYVNNDTVAITGSHVQYVDYNRRAMADFMTNSAPASTMVTGYGSIIETVYNLKGQKLGPRNRASSTAVSAAPMFSNTDKDGKWAVAIPITSEADWFYQSFCSAHLEEKYQWGRGIGLVDDIWMTNEEWNNYAPTSFVGLSAHAIDIKTKTAYATGAFTNGGFEKIFELNPQHEDFVIFGVAGYNGDFGSSSATAPTLNSRRSIYGLKPDGTNYTWTVNTHPYRFYVGKKGMYENGTAAPADDFLARNGLRYGKIYGFAVDISATGPTKGLFRDAFHRSADANNGAFVPGQWVAQNWSWDGQVKNFEHDGSWDYQLPTGVENMTWWNAGGLSSGGCKCEHGTPDLRANVTGFIQGSTCGHFGHLYVDNVKDLLNEAMVTNKWPTAFPGRYYVYQGERSVVNQIILGGEGKLPGGRNATYNWNSVGYGGGNGTGKVSFSDIDGMEMVMGPNQTIYLVIQEDSGNVFGERQLITKLEHEADGNELTYYFSGMSGGRENSRTKAFVGIPKGTGSAPSAHEFSGVFDISGLVRRKILRPNEFVLNARDTGAKKRMADALTPINEKLLLLSLQAHSISAGVINGYRADRGGQVYLYQPNIPV